MSKVGSDPILTGSFEFAAKEVGFAGKEDQSAALTGPAGPAG
jgi:hypothetical protein